MRIVLRCLRGMTTATASTLILMSAAAGPARPAAGSLTEEFTSTTYKDSANTTADWNTASGRLQLFPFAPALLGSAGGVDARAVAVSGTRAYAVDPGLGLRIYDVTNPATPSFLGGYDTPGVASDLLVVGATAYVADSGSGLQILDVTNLASPTLTGTYNTPGTAHGVSVSGTRAYVADMALGVQVLNISSPASPTLLGTYNTAGAAEAVVVDGTRAYVADGGTGLIILDVSNPASITQLGFYNTPDYAYDVMVTGNRAWVADGTTGLLCVDVSNPAAPSLLGSYNSPSVARRVQIYGSVAIVADQLSGIEVVDVSTPSSPTMLFQYDTPGSAWGVAMSGTTAWIADGSGGLKGVQVGSTHGPALLGSYDWSTPYAVAVAGPTAYLASSFAGLEVLNVGNPASPTLLGSYDTPGNARSVAVTGTIACVADELAGLQVINVGNPASPTLLGTYDTPGKAISVAISGRTACVVDENSALRLIDIGNPASPSLSGSYPSLSAKRVAVVGTRAYLAALSGFSILEVSNPASPTLLGAWSVPVAVNATAIAASGAIVCVAFDDGQFHAIDASSPSSPVTIQSGILPEPACGLTLSGTIAAVADGASGLRLIDVTKPWGSALQTAYGTTTCTESPAVAGNMVFFSEPYSFRIIEIAQNRLDLARNQARSLVVNTPYSILRMRVVPTMTGNAAWELSSNSGTTWVAAAAGTWVSPGAFSANHALWRCTLSPTAPANSTPPEVERLSLEWLFDRATITSITDIGNDQGGWVRVRFRRSGYDHASETAQPITQYGIWRRVDGSALAWGPERSPGIGGGVSRLIPVLPAGLEVLAIGGRTYARPGPGTSPASFPPGTWELVTTVPALQVDDYTAAVPTLGDSTGAGASYTVLAVTAHTTTPASWYVSAADSGYSVDNIAPGVPQGLQAMAVGASVSLGWLASEARDFEYFRIYRGDAPGFSPDGAHLVHATADLAWLDSGPGAGTVYYKLTAVDHAGNEGNPAAAAATVTSGVDTSPDPPPRATVAASPNPFRSSTRIRCSVPAAPGILRLTIHDVRGRRIRTLIKAPASPGEQDMAWDGRDDGGHDQPAGQYYCRLEVGGKQYFTRVMRVR